ncbi:MAG: ABC transporter ATP-binding protein [Propionibacteriaceae bacterium]|jgi:NitT/TauT family transport system ATP-binding protein|nr:ABC transporter ATP-binding protein [Propionibacteriaceae bacterium]
MIRFTHVTKSFGGRRIIDDLSFTVPDGGVVALTGPNGSGKSTVVKLVMGLLLPDGGTIEGIDAPVTAVFQEDRLCEQLTAVGNVRLVLPPLASQWSVSQIRAELAAAGLSPDVMDRPVRQLSGGERRRVCLARAMLAPSKIVCLDEAFTGIDSTVDQAIDYVRSRLAGRDTLLVTHSRSELKAFGAMELRLGDPRPAGMTREEAAGILLHYQMDPGASDAIQGPGDTVQDDGLSHH